MKPVRLKMTAFECYADTTEIDFTKFTDGIYIITGDTGSGKTTIFDAIKFALYSNASGEDRDQKNLKCDFCDSSIPTEVEFEFSHFGRQYRVRKVVKYRKKQGTQQYKYNKIEGYFYRLENDEWVSVCDKNTQTDVDAKIVEIIGMDKNQFSQIIMLAQGEFQKFLKANPEEKNQILSKLFDNSLYVKYQNIFIATYQKLQNERRELEADIQNQMSIFIMPEGLSQEEQLHFDAGEELLLQYLEQLIETDKEACNIEKEEQSLTKKLRDDMLKRIENAKTDNKNLEELEESEVRYEKLKEREEKFRDLEYVYKRADCAIRFVMPVVERVKKNHGDMEQCKTNIESAKSDVQTKVELYKAAEDARNENPQRKKQINAINQNIDQLRNAKQILIDSQKLEVELEKLTQAKEELEGNISKQEDNQKTLEEKQKILEEELKEYADVDVNVVKAENRHQKARQDKEKVCQFLAKNKEIEEEEGQREVLREDLKKISDKTAELLRQHNDEWTKYIDNQAFDLAKRLCEDIEQKGSERCPVCGTMMQDTGFLNYHTHTGNKILTKPELDILDKQLDESKNQLAAKSNDMNLKNTVIENQKEDLRDSIRQLLSENHLSDEMVQELFGENNHVLQQIECIFEQRYQEADAECKSMLKKSEKRDKLNESLQDIQEQIKQIVENLETYHKQLTQNEQHYIKIDTEYQVKKENLKESGLLESTVTSIQNQIDVQLQEREKLEKEYQSVEDNFTRTNGALTAANATLDTNHKREKELIREREELDKELAQKLSENGFDNLEAYEQATVVNEVHLKADSAWLEDTSNQIQEYKNKLQNLALRIEDLKSKTEGKQKLDITELETEERDLDESLSELTTKLSKMEGIKENHIQVMQKVALAKEKLRSTDKANRILTNLYRVANGENSENGIINFERYISGEIFKEILVYANERLSVMTGGAKELRSTRNRNVRSNSSGGIDFEVYDLQTGTARPAFTLSGGERFMTSLSLALGLSDVVRNRAGGMEIEALFIDEGFGTLDDGKLERSVEVLSSLTESECMVGVISHVGKLEENIPQKIIVTKGNNGSKIEMIAN